MLISQNHENAKTAKNADFSKSRKRKNCQKVLILQNLENIKKQHFLVIKKQLHNSSSHNPDIVFFHPSGAKRLQPRLKAQQLQHRHGSVLRSANER